MCDRQNQLLEIKKLCLNELKQAQSNCEYYSSSMTVLMEKVNENWQCNNNFLIEYDSFLTNVTTVMDAARKFNLHLHLNNKKLCKMDDVFSQPNKKDQQTVRGDTTMKEKTTSHLYPAEECDLYSGAGEDFVYPILNLSEVYKIDEVINGTVTHIKNLEELSFYVFDNSSKYRPMVVELSKSLELRQYNEMPTILEVFGCVLDNQIFRAVLGSKTYYDEEMNEEIVPCYILDTGEILPLKSDHIMYRLTKDQKNIPALAMPCQLKLNKNPFATNEKIEDKLKSIEYKNCQLKILTIEGNTLCVQIIDKPKIVPDMGSDVRDINNATVEADSNTKYKQLTKEELDILYEEPLNTSNAMKAVMGYDPQDDKRICRFYNPHTGGCFKGVNCRLEHTSRQADGWTKDILPTASIIDNHLITVFAPDSIINITPTYVGQLDRFFAQINDTNKTAVPLLWNDEDVPYSKILQKPPHMFEIVLSRYVDGLWYRAKIISHDDDYKMFKVVYVDYGNIQVVHLSDLASIDISMARVPFQAILCRFETVNEKTSLSAEERKNCIEILCEMILNKSMDVKVISHYEDLFISFIDKKTYPLPDVLIEMGYLELNNNKVLL